MAGPASSPSTTRPRAASPIWAESTSRHTSAGWPSDRASAVHRCIGTRSRIGSARCAGFSSASADYFEHERPAALLQHGSAVEPASALTDLFSASTSTGESTFDCVRRVRINGTPRNPEASGCRMPKPRGTGLHRTSTSSRASRYANRPEIPANRRLIVRADNGDSPSSSSTPHRCPDVEPAARRGTPSRPSLTPAPAPCPQPRRTPSGRKPSPTPCSVANAPRRTLDSHRPAGH